ncbi:MAG: TetR/AcrR family transcriptional regulator [Desulfatiglandales bacterium]
MDKQKKTHKVDEIRQVVARLFSEKGYHATSMREIGRALGMNQSSLYHYFKGKEEILYDLMNDTMDQGLAILKKICNADLSPEEKLSKVLSYYIRYYAGDRDRLTILANEMHALSENYRLVLTKKQREYVHLIMSILNELSAQNKMKKIHPTIATFAFFGMVVHTIKWYHKGGTIGLEELTESFLEIFTQGVVADHLPTQE